MRLSERERPCHAPLDSPRETRRGVEVETFGSRQKGASSFRLGVEGRARTDEHLFCRQGPWPTWVPRHNIRDQRDQRSERMTRIELA